MKNKSYLELGIEDFSISLKHDEGSSWIPLAPFSDLKPDTWHEIATILSSAQPVKHLLYMHFPNGGVHGFEGVCLGKPFDLIQPLVLGRFIYKRSLNAVARQGQRLILIKS